MSVKQDVIVFDSNETACSGICSLLSARDYRALPVNSLIGLPAAIEATDCNVLIVDLDNLSVDGKWFKDLKRQKPSLCIMVLSGRSFHPELQEAMRRDIYVCMQKPVDQNELVFWLKSLG